MRAGGVDDRAVDLVDAGGDRRADVEEHGWPGIESRRIGTWPASIPGGHDKGDAGRRRERHADRVVADADLGQGDGLDVQAGQRQAHASARHGAVRRQAGGTSTLVLET